MSDATDTVAVGADPATPPNGWVKLFSKSGALVTIPVTEKPLDYAAMAANVEAMIAAGFMVNAVGLEAGEEKDTVAFVLKGRITKEGKTTPYVLLYNTNPAYKHSFLKKYLNTPEDIADFETAAGMKLDHLPLYIGKDKPKRGEDPDVDKMIVPVRKPFGVIFKPNPKWIKADSDAAAEKKEMSPVPVRVWVRWEGQEAKPATTDTVAVPPDVIEATRAKWKSFFAMNPPLDVFNAFTRANWDEVPAGMRPNLNKAIQARAAQEGWDWDDVASEYVGRTKSKPVDDPMPF